MKKNNGNNLKRGEYYLGLDIGTDSVGWAVTDASENYNILKFKGELMQGVRLFDEANDSKERRTTRANRRRLARRKQRLVLLEQFFYNEIVKIDPTFFVRLKNSFLFPEDKDESISNVKFTLFNDKDFTDKDYMKKYPTIYHLRSDLIHNTDAHDIRLVYLAIHQILKKRGHFLFEGLSDNDYTLEDAIEELRLFILERYNMEVEFDAEVKDILTSTQLNITSKKKALISSIRNNSEDDDNSVDVKYLAEILSGAVTNMGKLFKNDSYSQTKVKLSDDLDEKYDELQSVIDDEIDFIVKLKMVYDTAKLDVILGGNTYICDSKISLFDKNKSDLQTLKQFVKSYLPEKYKEVFKESRDKLNNYVAYMGHGNYHCSQLDFCKYLGSTVKEMENDENYVDIWTEIKNSVFLTKLSSKDNGLIPNQIHRKELKKILDNASQYLDFLNDTDEYGTVYSKILSTFDYKIPYYIGPLNKKSDKAWVVRSDEKITPWNITSVVNYDASAKKFMENLIGRCEYTSEPVLPKDSLLYSEFMLLNELNPLKINGSPINVKVKQQLIKDLFKDSKMKVTKKKIKQYLERIGAIESTDEITGIDDTIKTTLKSYHTFKKMIATYKDTEMIENIILAILVYGDDKKLLKNWLKKNYSQISDEDVSYVCRQSFKDWGRLSKEFLCNIYSPDENGEVHSIIDMLRNTTCNLMQILSSDYQYSENCETYQKEHFPVNDSIKERLADMYISPSTRRAVHQALLITDEIVDIMKSAPKKIFIEVAREKRPEAGRTELRKNILLRMYQECGEADTELYKQLKEMDENRLRDTTLYLYFIQLGKCMYTGKPIDLEHATDQSYYDIDHIYPQSKILDNSLTNKVLVSSLSNRIKSNIYPIEKDIRDKMSGFWWTLKSKKLISEEKYARLMRSTELNDKELSAFVNRQLVETQQSTKAVATLFKELYANAETKIVYSKAGNVSRFRQQFDLVKCRDINDLHHAKDAYLNIVVGNVYDTKFTEKFFLNIKKENYSLKRVFDYDVSTAWISEKSKSGDQPSIVSVKKNYYKNSVRFTRMVKEGKGSISKETILPAGKGQLPIKQNLDPQKYGAYNMITGAYFFVVEHTDKKKRIRSLEPVFLYKKALFIKNPEKYCIDVLSLVDPVIIESKVPMESLMEIDGVKYNITGRTGNQIVCKHPYQLILDPIFNKYIKEICEYINKCKELKTELDASIFKVGHENLPISSDNNIMLYDELIRKLSSPTYKNVLNSINKALEGKRDCFYNLSIYNQCLVLIEILKAFKCDRQTSNLVLIGGDKSSGSLKFSNNLSNRSSAFLIYQSSTGLYEYKTDLLRKI